MYHTVPEMDWGGDFILSSQVWTTSRDLGRLGQLYLDDGVWLYHGKAKRILPVSRVADMARNFGAMKTIPACRMIHMLRSAIEGNF